MKPKPILCWSQNSYLLLASLQGKKKHIKGGDKSITKRNLFD